MELDTPILVIVRGREDFVSDGHFHRQLLAQLSHQALGQRLARIALSAGKLPDARQVHAGLPSGDQHESASLDESGRDDYRGRHWHLEAARPPDRERRNPPSP
jgi:hypothetical protein